MFKVSFRSTKKSAVRMEYPQTGRITLFTAALPPVPAKRETDAQASVLSGESTGS